MKFKFTTLTIHEARGETIEEIVAEVKHRTVMFSQNMFPLVRRTRTVVLHCYKRIDVASSKKLRNWPVQCTVHKCFKAGATKYFVIDHDIYLSVTTRD